MTILSALRKFSKATTCCTETLDDTLLGSRTHSLGFPRNTSTPNNNPHYVTNLLPETDHVLQPHPVLPEPDQFITPLQSPVKKHNMVQMFKPRNLYVELQDSPTPSDGSRDPSDEGEKEEKCADNDCMVCALAKPELRSCHRKKC